jgi:putative oxidoreductase
MSNAVSIVRSWYLRLARAASALQSPLLLVIRLYWGWQLMQTGWGKIQNIPRVTEFFTSLGIPFPGLNARFVSVTELVGGILLGVGLFSRPVALLIATDMFVAYVTDGRPQLLAFFSDPGKFSGYDAFPFLFAALLVLIFGPGKLSIDYFIGFERANGVPADRS